MNLRATLFTFLALVVTAAVVFQTFQRQLSKAWFTFGVHPDVMVLLDRSLEDQKHLARLDPVRSPQYRQRFEEVQALQARFRVLEYSRQEIVDRYENALLGLVSGIVLLAWLGYTARQIRQERRLTRLQSALGDLAAGRTDVTLGERGRDLIGRIALMIERASHIMARDRRRLASLENLSAWQEAARRHAHEMRTPLTAARLELRRLRELLDGGEGDPARRTELLQIRDSLDQDLERLGRFTEGFTSFGRLPRPRLETRDLGALVGELADLFAAAWPNLALELAPPGEPFPVRVDPEMLRQVLVNLCDNSALAVRDRGIGKGGRGKVVFTLRRTDAGTALDVADDGPGISPEVRPRLFEPYTTSRRIGEGMGLGLAISRKILLDHGGDLELLETSPAGTTFRLQFPSEAVAAVPAGEGEEP